MSSNNKNIKQYIEKFNQRFLFNPDIKENIGGAGIGSWVNYTILINAIKDQLESKDREQIELFLGASIEENEKHLVSLLSKRPNIFSFSIAFWYQRNLNSLESINTYCKKLLIDVRNSLPTQEEADKWVSEATLGIIETFPVDLKNTPDIDAILVNAIATKFNWEEPYQELLAEFTKGMDFWGEKTYLFSPGGDIGTNRIFLYKGKVFGEHVHESERNYFKESMRVKSIIGEENISLDLVYEAGIAPESEKVYLKTLEDFDNNKVDFIKYKESKSSSNLVRSVLPAWEVDSRLDLTKFGFQDANSLYGRIFQEDIDFSALQVFRSSYNKKGFEAAAVTVLKIGAAAFIPPSKTVESTIYFNKPFVAITEYRTNQKENNDWQEIPLFTSVIRKSVAVSDKSFK